MAHLHRCKLVLKGLFWIGLLCTFYQILIFYSLAWSWISPVISPEPPQIFQEVLVQYRPEATFSDIVNSYKNLGLNEVSYSPYNGFRRVRVPVNISVYTVAANLNLNPIVAYAEPNYLRTVHFIPNDPLINYQWHLNNPMMERTWDLTTGTGIIVAVLDTGVAYRTGDGYVQAPDLTDTIFIPGYDFINDDPYPDDDNRHGTHIAGTIAQSTNNLYGCAGVAPGCTIMPVKVLDETGYGDVAAIVDGIYYAINNGAQVINMSLGGTRPGKGPRNKSAAEEEAINYAVSQGIPVICSAGNEATNLPSYPASYEATICVTATKYDLSFASSYSNYGPNVDVCAPGGDLDEDLNEDGYPDGIYQQTHDGIDFTGFDFYFAEGTSSAAAFVSGVVALILSYANYPLTPDEVREILHNTAIDLGDPGWDQFYGWGLVNPLEAVQSALVPITEGYFIPYITNQFLNQSTGFVRSPLPVSVNPVNRIAFQANANFATSVQPIIRNNQQPFLQEILPYQIQNNFWSVTNGIISPPARDLFQNTYSFWPLSSSQNIYSATQSLWTENPYISVLGQYKRETEGNIISVSTLPYQSSLRRYPFFIFPIISWI